MRSSETPPTGNRGRNKAIRGRLPLPVSSSFDRSAPSAPRKDSPAHLLPPRPDRTRLSPPPGRGTLRRGAGSATGPAVTGRQAPDAVRPPGGRGVSRARACAVAAAAPRRSRSTATRAGGRGRPGGAAGATAPAPPAGRPGGYGYVGRPRGCPAHACRAAAWPAGGRGRPGGAAGATAPAPPAGRPDGYGYASAALAGARLMPAVPPLGCPGGYGCLPTVPLPGRPGGYGYAPAAPRLPRPCLPCRRVAAPALRLPADRAAARPSRRYGYPQADPVVPGPCPLRRHRPVPAATAARRPRHPARCRTYPPGRARCGRQAWLLACVGHGCGRPRPGRPGLSQAGVLPCAGPRCGHPRARPCPASSLCGCASEARSGGGRARRHPCWRRAADTPGPHRHRCPEDRYQRNVRIRIACRSRAAFAFRGCTRSRNARASASSLRNRARRRRRSASQSTSPPPASAPSPTLEAPAVPESRSARDPRPARADGFPRFCCSGIASSPQSVPPTFPRPDDLTPAKG
ncbi:hypothetical protein RKD47_003310 [Streptomyces albogriseolus]